MTDELVTGLDEREFVTAVRLTQNYAKIKRMHSEIVMVWMSSFVNFMELFL